MYQNIIATLIAGIKSNNLMAMLMDKDMKCILTVTDLLFMPLNQMFTFQ